VVLASDLPDSITSVYVVEGTARLQGSERIGFATLVTLGSAGVSGRLDLVGNQLSLASLSFIGTGSEVVGTGTLRTYNNGSVAEIDVSGAGHTISAKVALIDPTDVTVASAGALTISGIVSGTAPLTVNGTLTLSGDITYTGQTSITGGTLIVQKEFAGSADISLVTFTPTTLEVAFTTTPASAATYQLLGGSTLQTYATVTLTGAGGATGTYNSATSTLTID
jgi:autotransporter-associated beta strand protein